MKPTKHKLAKGNGTEPPDETDVVLGSLQAIERSAGRLVPDDVVAAAADPAHPLHEHFEWDDSKAAHAYRIVQARALIRRVQVVITYDDRKISTVHYVRDPQAEAEEQGYVSVAQLRSEPENAKAMLNYELSRVRAYLQRALSLADALGLRREVQAIHRRVEKVLAQIAPPPPEGPEAHP